MKDVVMKWAIIAAMGFLAGVACAEMSSVDGMQVSQCGVNSLYQCLKYHGINEKLDSIYVSIPADADWNVSLKQLADYAKAKGLHVKPVIRPTAADVQNYLTKDTSIILQYAKDMPDKSKFKHVVAMIRQDNKILIMDYPKQASEIEPGDLAALMPLSEGMLVLSPKPLINAAEFLNFRSAKSWGFYSMCGGAVMLGVAAVSSLRRNRRARQA
jgi:ABC-type bacteriocin/lantibiotic exporter with double-glycine peptidase domain